MTHHSTIVDHYKQWCAKNDEAAISDGRIGRYLKEQGVHGKIHWSGYKVYWGLQLVGLDGQGAWSKENRNETVRERLAKRSR